jgi:hypothetical protein
MRSPLILSAVVLPLVLALVSLRGSSAAAQPLAIFVHGDAAQTRLLPVYGTKAPIAVRVGGDARRFDAVTLTATGPNGTSITAPLFKSRRGFIGTVRLADPGTWSLGFTTRAGALQGALEAVPIAVGTPLGVDPLALTMLLLAAFLVAGGAIVLGSAPRLARLAPFWKRS